jgi:cbb3-type cytochrome oxidase cytochrome c subunit
MGLYDHKPCPCGSGLSSSWATDARGIPLRRTCNTCHDAQMKTYRPEVLSNQHYEAFEQIEPDEDY